jgi:hypothetical protein
MDGPAGKLTLAGQWSGMVNVDWPGFAGGPFERLTLLEA